MYSETPRWCSLPSRGTYYLRPEVWLPGSWSNFSNWCDILLAGRVALSPRARRGVRAPHFGDVKLAARCLLWLAFHYRNRRMGGGEGILRDQAVEDGIWNAPCGSDQFDLNWQGVQHIASWHILARNLQTRSAQELPNKEPQHAPPAVTRRLYEVVRLTQPCSRFNERIEHGLQIEGRAADHLKHVGGRGLLLQRLAQLVEQTRVLNGDDGLGGEVRDQIDLLVGKRANLLAVNREDTDKLFVLEHRDGENGPEPPKIDRRNEDGFAFDVSRLSGDIRDMNRPPGLDDTAQRRSRTGSLESTLPELGKCRRHSEHRRRAPRTALES